MDTRQGLCAQIGKLRRKDLKLTAENKIKNEAKFKFQGQSAISQHWFDLDFDWIDVNLSHANLIYIRNLFRAAMIHKIKIHIKYFKFQLKKSKCVETFKFHNDVPILKYCQKSLNSCCFSSLLSYFASIEQATYANAISLQIEETLKIKTGNRIDFLNAILKNEKRSKANQEFIIA